MLLIDELLIKNSYFGRNMHKNTLFFIEKLQKSPSAEGFTPQTPLLPVAASQLPPVAGGSTLRPPPTPH